MGITVNGERVVLEDRSTVAQLIAQQGHRSEIVAVELNGTIVPRRAFDQTLLHDDDAVEIVCLLGGG